MEPELGIDYLRQVIPVPVNLHVKCSQYKTCSVSWGCRIYQLHLCRGVRFPQRVSWIWHYTIWWSGSSNVVALGNAEYLIISMAPSQLLPGVLAGNWVPSKGQIELNCVLIQNWITWNRTVLTFKCVWTKSVLILN